MARVNFRSLFYFILCLNLPFSYYVSAQFIQTYVYQNKLPDGTNVRLWRPEELDPWQQIIDVAPWAVFLEYNCHYMTAICRNVEDFFASDRGKKRQGERTLFNFDFFTTTKTRPNGRSSKRRDKNCPTNWVRNQGCPHHDQEPVWRHDGEWWTTALAPPPNPKFILAPRLRPDGSFEESGIQYSCEEWPAASWIEGGDGTNVPGNGYGGGAASKRCAGFRCGPGYKAEQNWQADSHRFLGQELKRVIRKLQRWPSGNNSDKNKQVASFYFRMTNQPNGVAARVLGYSSIEPDHLDRDRNVAQAKRDEEIRDFHQWADTVTMEELETLGKGRLRKYHTFANGTTFSPRDIEEEDMFESPGMTVLSNVTDFRSNMERHPTNLKRSAPNPFRKRKTATTTPLLNNATLSAVAKARKIVEDAIAESSRLNAIRLASPLRNNYSLKPRTVYGSNKTRRQAQRRDDPTVPPLLQITDEIAAAAALVSEADARNDTGKPIVNRASAAAASGTFWMEHLDRKGTVPWGNDINYKVFRNVVDYGAVGDGVTDDTKAINNAMRDGNRCGEKCNGSTTKNAIVYFPPGKYRVSTAIEMPFGTQVIGDANNWPTIVASKNFIGIGVLSTDKYTGGGTGIDGLDQEWFINTANFYRQIRNIRIDVTATRKAQQVACLHYQVAQATSIQNVELIATAGSGQRGIFAENGSGGVMSDITFTGGSFGIYGGNQQFTAQRLVFNGCDVGVQVIWDWGWVWKSITMKNVKTGFRLLQKDSKAQISKRDSKNGSNGNIGSVSIIDSSFQNVGTAVLIAPPSSQPGSGSTGVIIENVAFQGVEKGVADTGGTTLLAPSPVVDHWALGPVYSSKGERKFSKGDKIQVFHRHAALLDQKGAYFERPKPQYEDHALSDFVHVKDFGAKGDGVTDDTAAFQSALYSSQGKILFVDAGSYILTSTLVVPLGTKLVGETWSQLVASGKYFEDANNPKVMLKVGNENDIGPIEMQDLIFTNRGPTAGLIMVEWNVRASSPGAAALWDCHARVGGATGTQLTPTECPPSTSGVNKGCSAASLMMHITPKASGYFENMWLWVSDHMIDDPDLADANNDMVQNSIYVARGLLIESQSPVWLYGTSSEHSVFYQYNFHNAKNIFAGMIQTESPYYQPTPKPPAPFEGVVGKFPGDPIYKCAADDELSGCDESWGVVIRGSENVFIAGAGIYSWFSTYAQDCIDLHACQKVLLLLEKNSENVRIQNLITIGAKYVAVQDGKGILSADNLNVDTHPKWSQISVFDVSRSAPGYKDMTWIDPKIWDMETPSFTCSAPCTVNIPPWTGATRVVDYPLITVSSGTWTSTITKAPLTMTNLVFEVVTIEGNSGGKRQVMAPFYPVPATTPSWPQVKYTGPDGKETMTGPTIPFPTPPSSIGPDAAAPAAGRWPQRAIVPVTGADTVPFVEICQFYDLTCFPQPWQYGKQPWIMGPDGDSGDSSDSDGDDWDGIPLRDDEIFDCPPTTTTTSTPSKPPPKPTPKPSPHVGDPSGNTRNCYNSGYAASHVRMDNAIISYCSHLKHQGEVLAAPYTYAETLPFDGNPWPLDVVIKLKVKEGCSWVNKWPSSDVARGIDKRGLIAEEACSKYLHAVLDSCNCEGVDKKQGGT